MIELKEFILSPNAPQRLPRRSFIIANWLCFLMLMAIAASSPSVSIASLENSSALWNAWLLVFVVILFRQTKLSTGKAWHIFNLFLYAYNRRAILLVILNACYFPIEMLILGNSELRVDEVMPIGTLALKVISYIYFYRLIILLARDSWGPPRRTT